MKEIILNPTENLYPFFPDLHKVKGLYIPQTTRDKDASVIFAGRDEYTRQINKIYESWNKKLNSGNITISLFSGLHASIILFMSIGTINSKVIILSPETGGHFATKNILSRLGYNVFQFPIDYKNNCIDIDKSIAFANNINPEFVFIARSNSMQYEDFSWLNKIKCNPLKIFDASQYLTGILTGKYMSPYSMGFEIIITSLHKDFPGTQQALCAFSKRATNNGLDKIVMKEFSKYISSIHPLEIFSSDYYINNFEKLLKYEEKKTENAKALYNALKEQGLFLHDKTFDNTTTQQIWVKCASKDAAYIMFKQLESLGIMLNYMELPYRLGYGLRIGTGAATLQGLEPQNCRELASYIQKCNETLDGFSLQCLREDVQAFLSEFIKE